MTNSAQAAPKDDTPSVSDEDEHYLFNIDFVPESQNKGKMYGSKGKKKATKSEHDVSLPNMSKSDCINVTTSSANDKVKVPHKSSAPGISGKMSSDNVSNVVQSTKCSNKLSSVPKFNVTIANTHVVAMADTAATCNIIDQATYESKLKSKVNAQPSDDKINPYASNPLKPVCKFTCSIECKGKHATCTFYVMPGKSGCLLSNDTSQKLGLVKIADHVINSVCKSDSVGEKMKNKYPKLFDGIGLLKNYEVELSIDGSVPPVAQRHRRVPFPMRDKVETELKDLRSSISLRKPMVRHHGYPTLSLYLRKTPMRSACAMTYVSQTRLFAERVTRSRRSTICNLC